MNWRALFSQERCQRKIPAGLARHVERADAGAAQIAIQRADRMIGDHVERTGDRERRNRRAAGQRFELHDAERVGEAREHEHVGGGQMRRQILALLLAEEFRFRIFLRQRRLLRAVADHDLGSRQIQRQKRFEILFDRDPAHGHEDRPRQIELGRLIRPEQVGVDAAGPEAEFSEAARAQVPAAASRSRPWSCSMRRESAAARRSRHWPGSWCGPRHIPESAWCRRW